jgi:methionine synthase I (cobalamin-dependent)
MDPFKNTEAYLKAELGKRILIMDGAMGTMIQQQKFTEDDYRGLDLKIFQHQKVSVSFSLRVTMNYSPSPSPM